MGLGFFYFGCIWLHLVAFVADGGLQNGGIFLFSVAFCRIFRIIWLHFVEFCRILSHFGLGAGAGNGRKA